MKTAKMNRRALLMSIISLILCCAMLIGTTLAWFTDSVSSANNKIVAGNLDIELYHKNINEDESKYAPVGADSLFEDVLWEPGHVEVEHLKIDNLGSLALQYQFKVTVENETGSTNQAGEKFLVSDYLKFAIIDGQFSGDRAAAVAAAEAKAVDVNGMNWTLPGSMLPEDEAKLITLVVWMPETVGNDANHALDAAVPEVTLGLSLYATQFTHEEDSFGKTYDGELTAATTYVTSETELKAALTAALEDPTASIALVGDVELTEAWTPIGDKDAGIYFTGTFDGNGYTISGLKVEDGDYVGLFGAVKDATIKNVTVAGTVKGKNPAGIAARVEGATVIENCVNNADIVTTTKGGGIVCNVTNSDDVKIINCVNNGTISGTDEATSGLGGIVGYINKDASVSIEGCSNKGNVTANSGKWAGAAVGYISTASKGSISGFTNSGTITGGYSTDSRVLKWDGTVLAAFCGTPENWGVFATIGGAEYKYNGSDMALYRVPELYEETTFTPEEGVTTIGSYAFAYNSNIQTITLPRTVKTLADRAFRDTSASTVLLNEGLENISYQAFRNALNVKEVTIPSTVKTISKEAFQNSGIKTLTVPASVTTIEYGAMRDMKELETVTINSNAAIPVYAFRACTNLKTVYLNGEDVTFEGRGMIFTNKENGDGSAITIYVKNETVKERLLAADTAAKDYGGYTIIVNP